MAGRCCRAQPLTKVEGATKHNHGMTCAAEVVHLRHVRSCAALAFGNQPTFSGTKCGTCMPGGSVILKIILGMLKVALQVSRLLLQLLPARQSPMLQKDAAVARDGSVLLHCCASEQAVATAQLTLIKNVVEGLVAAGV